MILIGLSGKLGVGKDLAADILCNDYSFHRVSVGRYIRRELVNGGWLLKSGKIIPDCIRSFLTYSGFEYRREVLAEKPLSPEARECLQWFGQMMVIANPRHWIDQVVCEIRESQESRIVFTDARRTLELNTVKEMGGHTVQVIRHIGKIKAEYLREYPKVSKHVTEMETDEFDHDYILANNGTEQKLKERIQVLMRDLGVV